MGVPEPVKGFLPEPFQPDDLFPVLIQMVDVMEGLKVSQIQEFLQSTSLNPSIFMLPAYEMDEFFNCWLHRMDCCSVWFQ